MKRQYFFIFIIFLVIIYLDNPVLSQENWTQKSSIPFTRHASISFVIGSYAYCGLGSTDYEGTYLHDMYKYDPNQDKWYKLSDFPGAGLYKCSSFTIAGKGYICLGNSSSYICQNDLWEYIPETDSYRKRAAFPGIPRYGSFAFVLGEKAFVGGGSYGNGYDYLSDIWQYDPRTDKWTQLSDFPLGPILDGASFVINDTAYVGCGGFNTNTPRQDFWKYNVSDDTWEQIENFPDLNHTSGTSFVMYDKGFIGTGINVHFYSYYSSFFYYDANTGKWNGPFTPPMSCTGRHNPIGFSINNIGYFGTGVTPYGTLNDLWSFSTCFPTIPRFSYVCNNLVVTFSDSSKFGSDWKWEFGDGEESSSQNPTHTYKFKQKYIVCLRVSNECSSNAFCDTLDLSCPQPIAKFIFQQSSNVIFFTNLSSDSVSLSWNFGDGSFTNVKNPVHIYDRPGQYLICLQVKNACDTHTFCDSVKIQDDYGGSEGAFPWIFPNPTNGPLHIIIPEGVPPANKCIINDMIGKEIVSFSLDPSRSHHEVDIGNLADALYFFRILNNDFCLYTTKIILIKE